MVKKVARSVVNPPHVGVEIDKTSSIDLRSPREIARSQKKHSKMDILLSTLYREKCLNEFQYIHNLEEENSVAFYSEKIDYLCQVNCYHKEYQIYISYNSVDKRFQKKAYKKTKYDESLITKDEDFVSLKYIPIECVAKDATNIDLNQEQLKNVDLLSERVIAELRNEGFPEMIHLGTGEREILLLPIDLENSKENVNIIEAFLVIVNEIFKNDKTEIDVTAYNPSRKLQVNKFKNDVIKEENLLGVTEVKENPEVKQLVTLEQIKGFVDKYDKILEPEIGSMSSLPSVEKQMEPEIGSMSSLPSVEEQMEPEIGSMSSLPSVEEQMEPEIGSMSSLPSVEEKNEKKEKSEKKSTTLIKLMSDSEYFLDQLEDPYAVVSIANHQEIIEMDNSRFKNAIMSRYYKNNGSHPGAEALREGVDIMRSMAMFSGDKRQLRYRVAYSKDAIYYDIVSNDFNAIKIDKSGCTIVEKPPIVFKRKKTMHEQIMPNLIAQPAQMLGLVKKHFRFKNDSEALLFAVYLISCFLSEISHVILLLQGSKGSSKSTMMKMIKKLLDPSATDILGMPASDDDLKLILSKNYVACFDNLSQLSAEKSNILCMSSTGGSMVTRKQYTNGEEFVLSIKHCVILNGINFLPHASDLLDRSIKFELERVPESERRTDSDLWESFDQDLPLFLGSIFNTLSAAMTIHETVELKELPRMADFTTWGFAIAVALGFDGAEFLNAYAQNRSKVNEAVLKSNPVGASVVALVKKYNPWTSSVTDFFDKLKIVAQDERINTNTRDWPKAANVLSRKLGEIRSNLEDQNIYYHTRSAGNYTEITIELKSTEEIA